MAWYQHFVACAHMGCGETFKAGNVHMQVPIEIERWVKKKAAEEGWVFTRGKQVLCPLHGKQYLEEMEEMLDGKQVSGMQPRG